MSRQSARKITPDDVPANTRRGGELRTLLSPTTVGTTSGFLGVATIQPGEFIAEHYHPYSEEFLYVADGAVEARCDGEAIPVSAGEALHVPIGVRHRLANPGAEQATVIFALSPLAPRPELGHVDTETLPARQAAAASPGKP